MRSDFSFKTVVWVMLQKIDRERTLHESRSTESVRISVCCISFQAALYSIAFCVVDPAELASKYSRCLHYRATFSVEGQ